MSTALYRRYRPETFADVIGQEHVTAPLMAAIDKDRINHAYLFSGPRGCGKTTSARILARCLNCAQGPTSTPCGTCDSCVALARNGSGSLDVIEIDAASHGGVDDARDLRERATFAPVRDRYKIFIIDEAHMVTSAGFNALLKIVEEPPEHILFIFATTEPDKVIGTIRSRTHHYPFRLVPPEPLMEYLEQLCRQENVPVAPGVLSLVIRAGGGSVRDSLSVLDQLMAGAGENGLDYELAVSLLGYTHATLLDDVVESMAADDAGTVFNAVDRVIQTGHDPRRFVEDLLERFRDLIVINAVPEGAASILRGVPDDQLNRMRTQATQLGAGELSRAADVTNTALTEMTGATSPRLHLELLCARLLLPAADASVRGTLARVDRIERRLEYAAGTPAEAPSAEAVEAPKAPARPRLDVPRNAEEAAARWSLPATAPTSSAPDTSGSPAPNAAAPSGGRPSSRPSTADSSPDWGGSWGVSTDSAFADPSPAAPPSAPSGPAVPAAQPPQSPAEGTAPEEPRQPADPSAQGDEARKQPLPDRAGSATDELADSVEDAWSGPRADAPAPSRTSAGPTNEQRPAPSSPADTSGVQRSPGSPSPAAPPFPADPVKEPQRTGPDVGRTPEQSSPSSGNIEMVRRAWPEIMDEVAKIKRATWLIVNVSAKPRSFEGNQLVLAFVNQGNAIGFQRGPHLDNLKQAIHTVLGLTCSIEAMHDAGGSGESGPKVPASQPARDSTPGPASSVPSGRPGSQVPEAPARPAQGMPEQRGTLPVNPATPDAPDATAPGQRTVAQREVPPATPEATAPGQRLAAQREALPEPRTQRAPAVDTSEQCNVPSPDRSRTGSHTAGGRGAKADAPRPSAPSRPSTPPRPPATHAAPADRQAAGGSEAVPEAVSAWNPSMSDDSWALVEPPEEAFDPGPGWDSVPEDPAERRTAPVGEEREPRHGSTRAPSRTEAAQRGSQGQQDPRNRGVVPDPRGAPENRGPQVRQNSPARQDDPAQPVPRSSRSVVWSPDTDGANPSPEPSVSSPTEPTSNEQARGIPHFIGSPVQDDVRTAGVPTQEPPAPAQGRAPAGASPSRVGTPAVASVAVDPATAGGAAGGEQSRPEPDGNAHRKPVSRYQQLLDEADRKRTEEAAAARGAVDLRFIEDEPSADDETLEDSGLVGRTAIERILNGRLIEERSTNGQ